MDTIFEQKRDETKTMGSLVKLKFGVNSKKSLISALSMAMMPIGASETALEAQTKKTSCGDGVSGNGSGTDMYGSRVFNKSAFFSPSRNDGAPFCAALTLPI